MRVFNEVLLHAFGKWQTLVAPEAVQPHVPWVRRAVGVLEALLAEELVEVAERHKRRPALIVHMQLVHAFALFGAREDPGTDMVVVNLETTCASKGLKTCCLTTSIIAIAVQIS